jgi:2'-5' RNA ligase
VTATVRDLLDDLVMGRRTLTDVSADFTKRHWPAHTQNFDEFDTLEPDPNSWEAVSADSRLTPEQYDVLAKAYASTLHAAVDPTTGLTTVSVTNVMGDHVDTSLRQEDVTTTVNTTDATDATDAQHTGAMIALIPTAADADRIAVEGGEAPDELHCTFMYFADAALISEDQRSAIIDVISRAASALDAVDADGFGISVFNPGDTNDHSPCVVLLLSGDELAETYDFITNLVTELVPGLDTSAQHRPWIPHITLTYSEDASLGDFVDAVSQITFDRVRVAFAGDVYDIPFGQENDNPDTEDSTDPDINTENFEPDDESMDEGSVGDVYPKDPSLMTTGLFGKQVTKGIESEDVSPPQTPEQPPSAGNYGLDTAAFDFDPHELRDERGRWSEGGATAHVGALPNIVGDVLKGGAALDSVTADHELSKYGMQAAHHYAVQSVMFNDPLRRTNGQKISDAAAADSDALDEAMDDHPLRANIQVYRGFFDPKHVFGNSWSEKGDNTGLTWNDPAFVSTSTDDNPRWGDGAGGGAKGWDGSLMRITVPKGSRALRISTGNVEWDDQHEVLLGRGNRFVVTKDHGVTDLPDGSRGRLLDVTMIPQDTPPRPALMDAHEEFFGGTPEAEFSKWLEFSYTPDAIAKMTTEQRAGLQHYWESINVDNRRQAEQVAAVKEAKRTELQALRDAVRPRKTEKRGLFGRRKS